MMLFIVFSLQNGFTFEKVSDILAMKVLPKAIRAGAGWRGSGANSSVEYNELLVVKGSKKRLNSKFLKVFNPATKKKKDLPESCAGMISVVKALYQIFCVLVISWTFCVFTNRNMKSMK